MATAIYNAVTSLGQDDVYQDWSDAATSLAVRPRTHLHARIKCMLQNSAAYLLNQSNPPSNFSQTIYPAFSPIIFFWQSHSGLYNNSILATTLQNILGGRTQSNRVSSVSATDLGQGHLYTYQSTESSFRQAVLASAAIPGL